MFEKFMQRFGTVLASLFGALLVATTVSADPYSPNGFALQSVATSTSCTDTGSGVGITNVVQVGLCAIINESLTWTNTQTFSNATPFAFTNGATGGGSTTLAVGAASSTADLTFATTDTGCTGTNTFAILFSSTTGVTIDCTGKLSAKKGLAVSGGNVTYSQQVVDSASCGTSTAGQANNSTCPGDSGFATSSAGGVLTITLGTMYSNVNKMWCESRGVATPTVNQAITWTASVITWTAPGNSVTYFWHCYGVSGG